MTKPAFRRVAVFVGTAALATGSGIGVAAAQGDEPNPSSPPRVAAQQTDETAAVQGDEVPRAADEV